MDQREINLLARTVAGGSELVADARRRAGIGPYAQSQLARTEQLIERPQRLVASAVGPSRHSMSEHSTIGTSALDAIERVRASSVRYAFQTDAEIWKTIEKARELRAQPIFEHFERARRIDEIFKREEAVEDALETKRHITAKRMSFLLDHVPAGYALRLMERVIDEGIEAFVHLLGEVLLEDRALEAFRDAVQTAATLSDRNRRRLDHALGHLEAEEYLEAFPSLINGVEGALRDAAKARGVRKHMKNARSAAALLKLQHEHEQLIGAIYAIVNGPRHGEDGDDRSDCVLALLVMVLWIEEEFGAPVTRNWLSSRLTEEFVGGYLAAA